VVAFDCCVYFSAAITLSEPAVTVLGEQLEEMTNGHIAKMTIRMTLAIVLALLLCLEC